MKFFAICILMFSVSLTTFSQHALKPVDGKSKVAFKIRNVGIFTDGTLAGLSGSIFIHEAAIEKSSADVTVDVSTINTDNERRDKHLRHADFFEVEKYPTLRIKSTSISRTETAGTYLFTGNLSIKSTTLPIQFPFQVAKMGNGYVCKGTFSINRLDYGVGESSATLSDEVRVTLEIYAE